MSRVEARREATDGAPLSGGVETLEEDEQTGSHAVWSEQSGRKEAKLRESMLRGEHALLGLFAPHFLGEVDVVEPATHW